VIAAIVCVSWGMILYSIKSPQIQNSMCFLHLVWRSYAPHYPLWIQPVSLCLERYWWICRSGLPICYQLHLHSIS